MSFDYIRPADWAETIRLMTDPGAVAKMGGCDVLTRYRRGLLEARLVVGLDALPGVSDLSFAARGARIGAGVTLRQLEQTPDIARRWPALAEAIAALASPAIRSSATLVGNVAQGWGIGDLVPLLEVWDAQLNVRGPSGERQIAVTDYAKTPRNGALRPGELIASLDLPAPSADFRVVYERFSFRQAFCLPLVSVAIGADMRGDSSNDIWVAAVGGSDMPARCPTVEAALRRAGNGGRARHIRQHCPPTPVRTASNSFASPMSPPGTCRSAGSRLAICADCNETSLLGLYDGMRQEMMFLAMIDSSHRCATRSS